MLMPKNAKRDTPAAAGDDWPDAPLPESVAARRRLVVVLILFALAALAAHLVSLFVA
jgi:hypothetical protein